MRDKVDRGGATKNIRADNRTFVFIFIALIGAVVFSNSFKIPFFFDDVPLVVENPLIRDLHYISEPALGKEFPEYGTFRRRLVGFATFALNYRFHGLEVTGYHAVNIFIHLVNSFLVYLFIVGLFQSPVLKPSRMYERRYLVGLLAALVFLLHPANAVAVNFIYQRLALLTAMSFLGSVVFYGRFRLLMDRHPRLAMLNYALAFLMLLMGALSKESTFTVPAVLIFYELLFFSGPLKKRLILVLPLFLPLFVHLYSLTDTGLSIESILKGEGADAGQAVKNSQFEVTFHAGQTNRLQYYATQLWVLATYLKIIILPIGQNFVEPYILAKSPLEPRVFVSFLVHVALISSALFFAFHRQSRTPELRVAAFGILWFYGSIAVEAVMVLPQMMVEYRCYVVSIGIILTVITLIMTVLHNGGRHWVGVSGKVFVFILLILLASRTYARNILWNDQLALWSDMLKHSPNNEVAHLSVGNIYADRKKTEKAIYHFREAFRIDPNYVAAHYNLAVTLKEAGRLEEAVEPYTNAILLKQGNVEALTELGDLYVRLRRYDKARDMYQEAARWSPDEAKLFNNLGYVSELQNRHSDAVRNYRTAVSLDPQYTIAWFNLANTYLSNGKFPEARDCYQKVLQLDPSNLDAYNNLGYLLQEQGDLDAAIKHYQQALQIDPRFFEALKNLSSAYMAHGQLSEASETLERARVIKTDPELESLLSRLKLLRLED